VRVDVHNMQNALLVGQTSAVRTRLLECVPTRPSQNDPKRVAAWQRRRRLVGVRIQALRIERDLTQEQLALLSGVSRNYSSMLSTAAEESSTNVSSTSPRH
jgi:hypothetical protein